MDWLLGRYSVSKSAVLLTERVFESDLVSKMPDLLTEWAFESDLVSKMPDLLTEWVFEGDLVSKMPNLLTEKGVRRAGWSHLTRRGTEGLPQLESRIVRPTESLGRKRTAYRDSGGSEP